MAFANEAVFALVDRIAAATSATAVWEDLLSATEACSIRYGCLMTVPPDQNEMSQLLSTAMPKGWIEGYRENELHAGDLVLEKACATTNSFEWRLTDWRPEKLSVLQRRWYEHCLLFGIKGGLCVLDIRSGQKLMLSFCSREETLSRQDRLALCFVGAETIHSLRQLIPVETDFTTVYLSQRERQCLEWAAAGKTDWEIGQILALSEKTVNVYISRAKSKFHVKTRAQAILQAAKAGIISA